MFHQGSVRHGTAVAEAVIDMAPEVSLYIANPWTTGNLHHAVDWMVSEGVDVINMSTLWLYDGPGDGTSPFTLSPLKAVDSAAADDIIRVNSGGNFAGRVWYDSFTDTDNDGLVEFAQGFGGDPVETNSLGRLSVGDQLSVWIRWDDNSWTANATSTCSWWMPGA